MTTRDVIKDIKRKKEETVSCLLELICGETTSKVCGGTFLFFIGIINSIIHCPVESVHGVPILEGLSYFQCLERFHGDEYRNDDS